MIEHPLPLAIAAVAGVAAAIATRFELLVIGVSNGVLLGTDVIGVAGFYGLVTLGCAVGIFGYVRWDKQHYG